MLSQFTRAELLDEWLTRRGYQPLRADLTTDVTTGTDLAAHLGREVADWVRHIYATAPPAMLAVTDGAALATLTADGAPAGGVRLLLPPRAGRVVSVRLDGWHRAAEPVSAARGAALGIDNPFLCPVAAAPLAVMAADGSLILWPADGESTVASLLYVDLPADDAAHIALDPRLLATVGSYDSSAPSQIP